MMRELLFRGQTRKQGEKVHAITGKKMPGNWVYGGIYQGQNQSIIYGYDPVEKYIVHSDTVGQYTGQIDKNGVKIFEGDLVEYDSYVFEAKYIDGFLVFDLRFGYNTDFPPCPIDPCIVRYTKVIGNIHDNPELLKGG